MQLDGTHSLRSKTVDLAGVVLLTATVSQTQTGYKSWLLKPFDPLFRKNGAGTRLVIRVAGTQDQPKVGLDIGKTLRGSVSGAASPIGHDELAGVVRPLVVIHRQIEHSVERHRHAGLIANSERLAVADAADQARRR